MENVLRRREARENAFLAAFSATFGDVSLTEVLENNREAEEHVVDAFGEHLLKLYYSHSAEVDDLIADRLRGWTMSRLPRTTLAILRLGVAELVFGQEKMPSVVINEAVELAKKYGGDEDYQFINGLMGSVAKDLHLAEDEEKETQE